MTIVGEKVKQSLKTVTLVTLEPARDLTDLLAADGGGVYSYTFGADFDFFDCERNAVSLTEVTGTPTSNDEWSFDLSTRKFLVKLAAAPSSGASPNIVMGFYKIYLKDNHTTEDDLDIYHNRIARAPRFKQSVSNILGGVMTIARQSLSIANSDAWLVDYLTQDDIYKNKKISVSFRVNGFDVAGFEGKLGDVSSSERNVIIDTLDEFIKLKDIASMGDDDGEIYHRAATGVYFKDINKPLKYFVNRSNHRWTVNDILVPTSAGDSFYTLDYDQCEKAVCTDFDGSSTTSSNRDWAIGRGPGLKTYVFGTISNINARGTGFQVNIPSRSVTNLETIRITTTADHNLEVGDTFTIEDNATTIHSALVVHIGKFAAFIDCVILTKSAAGSPENWTGNAISYVDSPAISVRQTSDNKIYYLIKGIDYTLNTAVTSGGNNSYSITFANNFESSHFGLNNLSPDQHQVFFRATTTQDPHDYGVGVANHSGNDVVERFVNSIGLVYDSVNSSDLPESCMFSLPYFTQIDYGNYLDYLQDFLLSFPAYLYLDPSTGKAVCKLLSETDTPEEIGDDIAFSISNKINTSDIYSRVTAIASQAHPSLSVSASSYDGSKESLTTKYEKNIYKYNVDRERVIDSLLIDPSDTDTSYFHGAIYKVKYSIGMTEIDGSISDKRVITSAYALGKDTTINGRAGILSKITEIDVGSDKIKIEAINI